LISGAKVSIFRFHDAVFSALPKFHTDFFAFLLRFKSTVLWDALKRRALDDLQARARLRYDEGSFQQRRALAGLVVPHGSCGWCKGELRNCRSVVSRKTFSSWRSF